MFRSLLIAGALVVASFSVNAMPMSNEVHTWYAGTSYSGAVTTGNLMWECGGGTCVLSGPYGKGLNMNVCQELSRLVGHLDYYYNDAGMSWSQTSRPDLLAQCNNGR